MRKIFNALLIFSVLFAAYPAQAQDTVIENKSNHSFEGVIGASWFGFQPFNLQSGTVSLEKMVPVYGSIDLRYCYKSFCPEIRIKESGVFAFDRNDITLGKTGPSGYNSYYVMVPTMIPMPFFSFTSHIFVDAEYTSLFQRFSLKETAVVNGSNYASGTKFSSVYSHAMVRLFVDTPIVANPSIFQHSYFGLFYSEDIMPATVSRGNAPYTDNLIVSAKLISAGIFYDMKKDLLVKGLNLGVTVHLGYGEMQVSSDFGTRDVAFGNLYGLFSIRVLGELSYRYVFKNNLGLGVHAGIEYFSAAELINKADKSRYNVNLGGGIKYYIGASFIFGL